MWEDGVGGVSAMVGYELLDLTKQVGFGLMERERQDRPGVRGRSEGAEYQGCPEREGKKMGSPTAQGRD